MEPLGPLELQEMMEPLEPPEVRGSTDPLELQGLMEAQAPQVKLVLKALPVQQEALELQEA
jgi:hypothetical protein